MKKIILSLTLIATCFWAQSQAVVSGVSPASVQGNYEYAHQAHPGWPDYTAGQVADEFWNLALDFNQNGVHVEGELELVYDATPGINPQGIDSMYEGCGTLLNTDLTNKIAVVYRNTCDFATKAYNAQQLGAIGLIILNREDDTDFLMTATAIGDGPNVTIPVVMLTKTDGANIINEMQSGPVVMFIGNKYTTYANDLGAIKGEYLVSRFGTHSSLINNNFDLGIQIYNYGTSDQDNATVNATITGPSGVVYDQTVNLPSMSTEDTVSVFNGNPEEFPTFDLGAGNYPAGEYTLVYTIDLGTADEDPFDNVFTNTFYVGENLISHARIDGAGVPISSSFPSNTEGEYQSCMFFQDANASNIAVSGIHFTPYTDTAMNDLSQMAVFITAYRWNDLWVNISDPLYTTNNQFFENLEVIDFTQHYPTSNLESGVSTHVPFNADIELEDNQRYLFCLQTYEPELSFGFDRDINYSANISISGMPTNPIQTDPLPTQAGNTPLTWFIAGWSSSAGSSIGLEVYDSAFLGLEDKNTVKGNAFPNPANDMVTVVVDATGAGNIVVTDISGKVALNQAVTLVNGRTSLDLSKLDTGLYIFNVTLENGKTSRFNVVKN